MMRGTVRGRALTIVSGLGALIALVVMLVGVAQGPEDGVPAPAGPFAQGSLTVGLEDPGLLGTPPEALAARIDRIAASGARFTRVSVRWVEIASSRPGAPENPDDPAYAWGVYDAVLDGLRTRGIEAILAISGAPGWANEGKGPEAAPAEADYRAFMTALARRYDGRVHARVRLFEAWEEPNNPAFLSPQWDGATPPAPVGAKVYATLLNAAQVVKTVDRQAQVIGIGTAPIATSAPPSGGVGVLDFMGALASESPVMDAAALRLQPSVLPNAATESVPSFAAMGRLIAELDRVSPGGMPIYVSFGYATGEGGVTEADQATAIEQGLERLAALPRVRLALWSPMQDTLERTAGLLRADGTEKPSWQVFAAAPKVLPSVQP